jgi:hypothetical protein
MPKYLRIKQGCDMFGGCTPKTFKTKFGHLAEYPFGNDLPFFDEEKLLAEAHRLSAAAKEARPAKSARAARIEPYKGAAARKAAAKKLVAKVPDAESDAA